MTGILLIILFAAGIGILIVNNNTHDLRNHNNLVEVINSHLPQTQCGKCGYAGCKPYAVAIARNEAAINQCPPGGTATIKALADLLNREYKPLNPEYGIEKPTQIAFIDEDLCIGCVKCIKVCPVDAIVGASKQMHTVIKQDCTGCELCIEPCPVDCIIMLTPGHVRQHIASTRSQMKISEQING